MRDRSLEAEADAKYNEMIQPLGRRVFRLPFYGLRTWILSLIALIALPVGAMVFYIGLEMADNLQDDWQEVTAIVRSNEDNEIVYVFEDGDGEITYDLDEFVTLPEVGEIMLVASLCDLTAWLTIPSDRGAEFPLWVNLDKPSQQSCVPISRDAGAIYLVVGAIAMAWSAFRLLRTIGAAASKNPKQ